MKEGFNMILVIFGLPGAGKNYIAKIISSHYGYHFYDADLDSLKATKKVIQKGRLVSEKMRNRIYSSLAKRASFLEKKYGNVVMPRTFTFERTRRLFKQHLPQSVFIFVKAKPEARYKRIKTRRHHINLEYAKKFDEIFEKPKLRHRVIFNSENNEKKITKKIADMILRLP
jgi:gluconokinase